MEFITNKSNLMAALNKDVTRIIEDTSADIEPLKNPPKRPLHEHEKYIVKTFRSASEVMGACEQMVFAKIFLSGYRSQMSPENLDLTRYAYIVYHLENHLIRTGMVLDRCLLLTNTVYQLGIPDRHCRFSIVAKNSNVNEKVSQAIADLRKTTQELRAERNKVIHRKQYSDEELDEIEIYHVYESAGFDPHESYFHLMKMDIDKIVASKKEELESINNDIFHSTIKIFDSLLPKYTQVKNSIRNAT
jgi:hypothetical protein